MLTLRITPDAYRKMRYFTELCDTEISGLGKVREMYGYLEIYDFEIFEQEVSSIHSNLDPDSLAKFMFKKISAGESLKDYKVWFHSHVDMEAFFSPIDDRTIETSSEFPYLISIVTNKKGHDKVRLDIFKPLRLTIPLEVELSFEHNEELKERCQKEIEQKLKKTSWEKLILRDKKKCLTPNKYNKKRSPLSV